MFELQEIEKRKYSNWHMPEVERKTRQVRELTHYSTNVSVNEPLEPDTPIPINKPYVPKPFIMGLPLSLSTIKTILS